MIRERIAQWLLKAASRGAVFLVGAQHGMPHYNSWSTDKAVREGYKACTWVYACVRKKADQVASVPLVVWKKVGIRKVEWQRVHEHPLELLLQRPNPKMPGTYLTKSRMTYLNLSGNNFWYVVEVGGRPVEIWPLRPDRVAPIPSRTDFISGYEYTIDGATQRFEPEEIVHFTRFDPGDDFLGMGPLQAAAKTVDTLNEARDWNKNAMENRAVPPGGFSTDSNLSDPQFDRLKEEIKEKISGSPNARKPVLMEAGLKWQSFAMTPVEMDFLLSMKFGVVEVCSAFGVDPILIGFNEYSSYNNYQTAKQALWEDTLIPELEDDCARINHDITPRFGDNLWVEPDLSDVPALQEKFEDKVKAGQTLWQMGVPFSKINERLELGMDDVPDADIQWIPAGMVPMNQEDDEGEAGGNPEPEEDEPKSIGPMSLKVFNLQTAEQHAEHWKAFERARTGWYKAVEKRTKKRFKDEKKAILKAVGSSTDGLLDRLSSVVKKQEKPWAKFMTQVNVDVITDFGKRVSEGFKSEFVFRETKEFDVFASGVKSWIAENVGSKIPLLLDTTLEALKQEVDEAIEEGETIDEIAERISDLYDEFQGYRSTLIARTEVISSSNAGSHFAAEQTELKLEKDWLATPGKRTREWHKKANGQRKKLDEPFVVKGEKLIFPGDSTNGASADNLVQCRCTQTYKTVR
ncbi:phage portal protein [Effusibacillus consociatus]|uniref:Phage portal protein n=1 Tax=Effusibacillus consociatus TaxID=1117041 RepID=A0ABV9Q4K3_9BACL